MQDAEVLVAGRTAFDARAWDQAYLQLSAADQETALAIDDLESLAAAAYLSGRGEESGEVWARAYAQHLSDGAAARAAGCAYWLAFTLVNRGEHSRAGGWVARAIAQLDDDGLDCVERGYLLMLTGIQALMQGEVDTALQIIDDVASTARRFRDADLMALSSLGRGQTLIALGQTTEGMTCLDAVMVAATAGELSEAVAGLAYCAVIGTCYEIFDIRRAQEWTAALTQWCAAQPELVPYSGHCLVHRAELMQLNGDWQHAAEAVEAAHKRYALANSWNADGMAYYTQAELSRLCGDFEQSENAFREASRRGHDPQPGLAMLRLAQGNVDAAAAATRRLERETRDEVRRARILAVHIEVMLAAGDVESARSASTELSEIAEGYGATMLRAVANLAEGAVLLAEGDAGEALNRLRPAVVWWRELNAPYEAARARALIGVACLELGDREAAELELESAREAFVLLGARPDARRVGVLLQHGLPQQGSPQQGLPQEELARSLSGMTAREVEVLRLVAAGKTNRAIAAELVLSEKTIARHLSNIFAKLNVQSRAAATGYAYEHGLIERPG